MTDAPVNGHDPVTTDGQLFAAVGLLAADSARGVAHLLVTVNLLLESNDRIETRLGQLAELLEFFAANREQLEQALGLLESGSRWRGYFGRGRADVKGTDNGTAG